MINGKYDELMVLLGNVEEMRLFKLYDCEIVENEKSFMIKYAVPLKENNGRVIMEEEVSKKDVLNISMNLYEEKLFNGYTARIHKGTKTIYKKGVK